MQPEARLVVSRGGEQLRAEGGATARNPTARNPTAGCPPTAVRAGARPGAHTRRSGSGSGADAW